MEGGLQWERKVGVLDSNKMGRGARDFCDG